MLFVGRLNQEVIKEGIMKYSRVYYAQVFWGNVHFFELSLSHHNLLQFHFLLQRND